MTNVAAYLRVSTTRQAEHDLSLPDQLRKIQAYCESQDWTLTEVFEERGASGTSINRPELQRMLARATSPERPFDVIVVYSLSRFARNLTDSVMLEEKLRKKNVKLKALLENYSDDANGNLLKGIMGSVYEFQSAFGAAVTANAMIANAELGFWNGSRPPLGFRTYVAEVRGTKSKKKLEIEAAAAETVKFIFQLYVYGTESTGPLGITGAVKYLKDHGITYGDGRPFSVQYVHDILTNEAYIGRCYFNRRDSRTKIEKPRSEWIEVPVPAIISQAVFDAAQSKLDRHHPIKMAPRLVRSSVLLTGLAKCKACGGPLKVQTGKSNQYHYYVCARAADQAKAKCSGLRMNRQRLDNLVLQTFCERVLQPHRLKALTEKLVARSADMNGHLTREIIRLESDGATVQKKLKNLYAAVASGIELDAGLRSEITRLQEQKSQIDKLIDAKTRKLHEPFAEVSEDKAAYSQLPSGQNCSTPQTLPLPKPTSK
jgi:site-specific DNA recombinase